MSTCKFSRCMGFVIPNFPRVTIGCIGSVIRLGEEEFVDDVEDEMCCSGPKLGGLGGDGLCSQVGEGVGLKEVWRRPVVC